MTLVILSLKYNRPWGASSRKLVELIFSGVEGIVENAATPPSALSGISPTRGEISCGGVAGLITFDDTAPL
jgi:hypothetical protein